MYSYVYVSKPTKSTNKFKIWIICEEVGTYTLYIPESDVTNNIKYI